MPVLLAAGPAHRLGSHADARGPLGCPRTSGSIRSPSPRTASAPRSTSPRTSRAGSRCSPRSTSSRPQYWMDVPHRRDRDPDGRGQRHAARDPHQRPLQVSWPRAATASTTSPTSTGRPTAGPTSTSFASASSATSRAMFTAFLSGETGPDPQHHAGRRGGAPDVDPSIGRTIVDTGWQYEHLDFNFERSNVGLDDPNVRRALAMAIDKQTLLDVLFPGAGLTPGLLDRAAGPVVRRAHRAAIPTIPKPPPRSSTRPAGRSTLRPACAPRTATSCASTLAPAPATRSA